MENRTMIICDLDGTLRNNKCADHLVPEVTDVQANWHDWQDHAVEHCQPFPKIVNLVFKAVDNGDDVVIFTSSQYGTREWLMEHCDEIYDKLVVIERGVRDTRSSFEYKVDFIDLHEKNIELWIDDAHDVCEHVRSLGIATVEVKDGDLVNIFMGNNSDGKSS